MAQLLNNLTDAADQIMTVPLADGTKLQLEFIYRPGIQRWTMNLSHPSLKLNGVNIAQGPNILRQWRNVITFGMSVISTTGLDPIQVGDFQQGNALIYILTAAEVLQVETEILAPVPLVNP